MYRYLGCRFSGAIPSGSLAQRPVPDEVSRHPVQPPRVGDELGQPFGPLGMAERGAAVQQRLDDLGVRQTLEALGRDGRGHAAALYAADVLQPHGALAQRAHEVAGGSHRVLHREVDADAEDRRHGMGGVADAQQSRPVPAAQPVQPYVEQLDLVPRGDGVRPVGQPGDGLRELGHEAVHALGAAFGIGPLGDEPRDLPVVAAVDERAEEPLAQASHEAAGVVLVARQPEPPGVHRAREALQAELGQDPGEGSAAVTGHGQRGPELAGGAVRGAVPHARDPAPLHQEGRRLGVHAQPEGRLLAGLVGEQVEQVPLRNHRDVVVLAVQRPDVPDRDEGPVRPDGQLHRGHPPLRESGEPFGEADVVQQRQGGRVHGVAAEVAQEVAVFLQDGHLHPGPGQQQGQHHPGGPASHHTAGRMFHGNHSLRRHRASPTGRIPHPRGPGR